MDEVESYELSLLVKQLKLAVKFPCRLTLQHAGTPLSPQIQSNGTNIFAVNKQVNIKEDKHKDYLQININLATDKGGNIMAGIIKINLKDISNSEGENLTVSLQKCLDPYATCLINIKSVRINRSRVKKGLMGQDRKKYGNDHSRFQTKSEIMILDGARNFKQKPRYNEAESFVQKRVNLNTLQSAANSNLKEKALSMAGFRGVNASFDREEMGSRFKHLTRKEQEDNKTVITGKWKDPEQTIKASMQATQKSLKLQIIKFKTKHEESERNLQQKSRQIKNLKDQISQLNRQLTQKQYLIDQNNAKSSQIAKLEQANKQLSRQINEERNKIIDLQRQMEEQKNSNFMQLSRYKQDNDKKQYQFQKNIYEKKQQIKQISQENQYKINQINKMKSLIEDLQKNLDVKTYEFEKNYNNQRNQHNKAKAAHQQKVYDLTTEIKRIEAINQQTSSSLKKTQEQLFKLQKKIIYLQQSLVQNEKHIEEELKIKQKIIQDKKKLQKIQQQLNLRLKNMQKDLSGKQKELQQTTNQLNQFSASTKKRLAQLLQKNKTFTSKIQQLQNKVNLLTAQEEKLKRNLQVSQKQAKTLQQNQKMIVKNLKLKDDRILQLQKQLTDLQNKNSMKDNLTKKQAQYKGIQLQKLTVRAAELQKLYQRQKQAGQQRRLQLLKSDNKIKMLEENNSRLTEQIKQLKVVQIKKDDEWNQKIRELKDDIKALEARQAENNKELHSNDIQKINFKNQISKLEKIIQTHTQKFDRLKKRQAQLQTFVKALQGEIQQKNEQIVQTQASYKVLQNQYKFLQADKSKTEKISTIINEEKDLAKNDINKLKKELQKREQKQESYLSDIKNLKEQITKWELKLNASTKDHDKFKTSVSQAIKNCYSIKSSYATLDGLSPSLDHSRGIGRSRIKHSVDYPLNLESSETKHSEAIQIFAKQSHQTVMLLNDQLKKSKRERELLEKQLNALDARSKETEEERTREIKEANTQIQTLTSQYSSDIEQYQEKIFGIQKELKKREKQINDLTDELNELRQIHHNSEVANEMSASELVAKINSLKNKITDWQRKDENNSHMFVNFQQKLAMLQAENTELNHQNQVLSQQLSKKEKLCQKNIQHNEDLTHQLQNIKKVKSDLSVELHSFKENLTVEKQSNRQLLSEIKQEEEKNSQLRLFNNELLKEKENLIKRQAQRTEKIYGLQQKIQIYMIEIAQKNQQISKRDKINTEYRDSIKVLQNESTNNQIAITDLKLSLERQKEKVKEKQRKIVEKQSEIQNLNSQIKKSTAKYETKIANLSQENECLSEQIRKQKEQNATRQHDLEGQLKKLKQTQKKLNDSNQSLQELIFFQKQTNSLNQTKVQELRQEIIDLHIEIDQHRIEIGNLNEELREKDQSLFALSGKLYSSDNRLESKEDEFKGRLQKLQLEWRYKIEQICQQYENKLQLMERQKNYVKTGVESINQTIQKLQNEKANLLFQMERQRQNWQIKLKKVEEDKLSSLIEKNKQIQRIREVFEQLEQKMKRKDFQFKTLQDDKKKTEDKLKELRSQIQKSQDKKSQVIRNLEKEIDQLKRKEGQLKRFKEALKNNQWAIERQIKKNIQLCSKGIAGLASQQSKDDVMNMMRNLQLSITKLALPNIDEL